MVLKFQPLMRFFFSRDNIIIRRKAENIYWEKCGKNGAGKQKLLTNRKSTLYIYIYLKQRARCIRELTDLGQLRTLSILFPFLHMHKKKIPLN